MPDWRRWWPGLLVLAAYLATRFYLLRCFTPRLSDIAGTYVGLAVRGVDCGQTPYLDFAIQYPPAGWWLIALPRLLDSRQWTLEMLAGPEFNALFHEYARVFRQILLVFDLAAMFFFWRLASRRRPQAGPWITLAYVAVTTILGHLLFDRLDLPLLTLLLFWATLWLLPDRAGRPRFERMAAWIVLGLSVSFKAVPALIVPLLLIATTWETGPRNREADRDTLHPAARQRRTALEWAIALVCLAVGAGLPLVIHAASSGWKVLSWVPYQWERGINLDSLYGSILAGLRPLGVSVATIKSHDAIDLLCPQAGPVKLVATAVQLAMLGGTLWLVLRNRARYDRQAAYCTSLWLIVAAVIASNVFSPQYLIWALPLALLLATEVLPARPWPWLATIGLALAIAGLTTWIFPYHYLASPQRLSLVPDLAPAACAVLILRNAAYLALVFVLGLALFRTLQGRRAAGVSRLRAGERPASAG